MRRTLRILFISPEEGAPPTTGGGERTHHLFRALSTLGEVDVLVSTECWPDLEPHLLEQCRREFLGARRVQLHRSTPSFIYPTDAGPQFWRTATFGLRPLLNAIESRRQRYKPTRDALRALDTLIDQNRYDVIVGRLLRQTAVSGALDQTRVPVICDLDDLDEIVLDTRIRAVAGDAIRSLLFRWHLAQITRFAPELRTRCTHVWVASNTGLALVAHPSISSLTNIPYSRSGFPSRPGPTCHDRRIALFVGSCVHPVKRAGLAQFHDERLAGDSGALSQCISSNRRLGRMGSNDRCARQAWCRGCRSSRGSDARIRPGVVRLVPIKEGAGTKIKVAEALAFGRAVIAYQHSVRGYELALGKGLLSASTDEEMVAACLELFAAPDRRDAMAIQGHAIACASFSYARFQHEVVETTRRVALMTPSQAALQP
jgi:hypothetical protein